jgi:uncharacterized protein YbjT (DUF2867 family)
MNHPCVIGASGLIGSLIVDELLQQTNATITLLVRRPLSLNNSRIKEVIVDFANQDAVAQALYCCDTVFVAIGTTQQKVKGNLDAYRKVDYDIPVNVATACVQQQITKLLLVSSIGANSQSANFYLKLKGEVEDVISAKPIPYIGIFQPSLLLGARQEFRLGEKISQVIMPVFSFLIPAKYKPIKAATVAKAMVKAALSNAIGVTRYTYRDMNTIDMS